ncbi:MAG: site-2 protease family protein, partial [Candidatus Eremiobacteraeota bacterium]|nr:site-2 protease family protein [Candidatus Eremiobacteraeota bacterium]
AKPVPINPGRLRNPKRDSAMIAAAGPIANFTLAAIAGLLFRFGILPLSLNNVLSGLIYYLVMINVGLGIFNLIPIPPLDGWKVLQGFMPSEIAYKMMRMEYANPMITWLILGLFIISPLPELIIGIPFSFLVRLFTTPLGY